MANKRISSGLVCVALAAAVAVHSVGADRAMAAGTPALPDMVDKKATDSIEKGLNFLAKTQRADGQWFPTGGYGSYPTVMTAMAGLAFVAGGSTPESGPYAKNVRKAMFYCLRVAEAEKDGLIAGSGNEGQSMYGHGFAMLFLAQCYGMDLDEKTEKRVKDVLDKAIHVTEKCQSDTGKQNNNAGGWIYTPNGGGDEGSVTVTQIQALRACRNAGLKVAKSTLDRAVAYLKISQNGDGGISYSYANRGQSRPAISAAAIACFYAAGIYDRSAGGDKTSKEAEMVDKLIKYCSTRVNVEGNGEFGGYFFYTHLYYAEAMYQRGGKDWKDYYPKIKDKLINQQAPDGSWNGDGIGTAYGTGIACIILQLPYGYLPICQR